MQGVVRLKPDGFILMAAGPGRASLSTGLAVCP